DQRRDREVELAADAQPAAAPGTDVAVAQLGCVVQVTADAQALRVRGMGAPRAGCEDKREASEVEEAKRKAHRESSRAGGFNRARWCPRAASTVRPRRARTPSCWR